MAMVCFSAIFERESCAVPSRLSASLRCSGIVADAVKDAPTAQVLRDR